MLNRPIIQLPRWIRNDNNSRDFNIFGHLLNYEYPQFYHRNFYLRKHEENGARIGVDRKLMLAAAGVSADLLKQPLARLAPEKLARLFQVIWAHSDDDFLGMALRPIRYGSFAWLAEQLVKHEQTGTDLFMIW